MRIPLLAVLIAFSVAAADLTAEQRRLNVESFEYAWKTIRDKMWEPMPPTVDWQKVHDEVLPKVEGARTMDQAREAMRGMIERLKMSHFNIFPGDVYDTVAAKANGEGAPGFDVRVIDGEALVVSVEPSAPAAKAGVRPGWQLVSAGGKPVAPAMRKVTVVYRDATTRELILARVVLSALSGGAGETIKTEFVDERGKRRALNLTLTPPRGGETKFGLLPTQHVWFESKRLGDAGYIRFNMFLDPARISAQFGEAVEACMKCAGMIVDLRGNPGGLGAMSMGMSGWFLSRSGQKLGTMKLKDTELKFVAYPRPETYSGPLAILIDGLTGSTAEIFAGGLKDLGRAHIIGTRSAGAALPSMFERLPNGDGFQYAVANYISEGGKALEGIGVIPDEEVKLSREVLIEGRDPVVDAALAYISKQKDTQ